MSRIIERGSERQIEPRDSAGESAPLKPAMEGLIRFWREILGVETVGQADDFFELGGSSLAVVMLLTAIEEELGVVLELEDLFIATTLDEQMAVVEAARLAAQIAK